MAQRSGKSLPEQGRNIDSPRPHEKRGSIGLDETVSEQGRGDMPGTVFGRVTLSLTDGVGWPGPRKHA
jgi:hypothetical protein